MNRNIGKVRTFFIELILQVYSANCLKRKININNYNVVNFFEIAISVTVLIKEPGLLLLDLSLSTFDDSIA